MKITKDAVLYVLLLATFLLFSCEQHDPLFETDKEVFTTEEHLVIGQTLKEEIQNMPETYPILDRIAYKDAYAYVGTLLNSLRLTSLVSHRNDLDWRVFLVHDDTRKMAFALPNGNLFLSTGLLRFLEAEHELVAILANEMAYAEREKTTMALRENYGGVVLGDILLRKDVELSEIASNLPYLEFDEASIEEADEFTVDLICPFKYDIAGLKEFLQRAEANNIEWVQSKSHQDFDARLQRLEQLATVCGEGGITNWEQYKKKMRNFLPR